MLDYINTKEGAKMKKLTLLATLVLVVVALGFQVRKGVFVEQVPREEPTPMERFMAPTDYVIDQDWDAVTSVPAEWTVIDADGDSVRWQVYSSDVGITVHSEPNCVASNYNAAGNDDWLITPQITVGEDYILDFWYAAHSEDWPDDIEVAVSTGTANPADFTDVIFSELGIPTTWQRQTISLAAYEGGDIYIGFHNISVDEWLLKVDDIKVGSLPDNDLSVAVSAPLVRVLPPASFTPEVTVSNEGALEADPTVYCEIYHGEDTVYSENVAITGLASTTSDDATFPAFSPTGNLVYMVSYRIDSTGDATPDNNSTGQAIVTYNTTPRRPFAQKFTSVGCPYCPRAAVGCSMLKDELGDSIIIVSYHSTTSFGSDPFYLSDSEPIAGYFGVTGYPTVVFNGMYLVSGGYPGPDYGYTPYMQLVDSVTSKYTAYEVELEVTALTAVNCTFNATVTRTAELPVGSIPKIRYAVVENGIPYSWGDDPALSTVEHCVRSIPGGSDGIDLTGDTLETDEQTFTLTPSWVVDSMDIIAYVQDDLTGEVYNAAAVPVELVNVDENIERPVELNITAAPNPFNSAVRFDISTPDENATLEIVDLNGRIVRDFSENLATGTNKITWNATDSRGENIASGIYLVRLKSESKMITRKITLIK